MITAIIVDDEQKNVSMLVGLLQDYCPQVTLLGTANNITVAKDLIEKLKPQLIFLDIEMPYGNGFDLLQSMPQLEADVIFITAFGHYALNAFRYAALDYLLKPVNIEQLQDSVARAEIRVKEKNTMSNYEVLLRNLDEKDASKQAIVLNEKAQQHFISLGDIMYIIADGSYTHIHTAKRSYVSTKHLVDYENMLPKGIFCRIHHGHLVNTKHIEKVERGRGGTVIMKDGKTLEIAVRRKEEFLKMLRK